MHVGHGSTSITIGLRAMTGRFFVVFHGYEVGPFRYRDEAEWYNNVVAFGHGRVVEK